MENDKKIILAAVDFEEVSMSAARQACAMAKILEKKVVLLFVYHSSGFLSGLFSDDQKKRIISNTEEELKKLSESLSSEYGVDVDYMVKTGSIHAQILSVAEQLKPRFIVMGNRSDYKSGDAKPAIGSIASKVIRTAKCPVITTNKPDIHEKIRNIILPLDLTEETRQKVGVAIEIAKKFNSSIHVVSALWSKGNKTIEFQLKAQLNQVKKLVEKAGITCTSKLVDCDESCLVPTIMTMINTTPDIDLLIIMTQQENLIVEYFMGSTAQELIRLSEIPVMSVVPKEMGTIMLGY